MLSLCINQCKHLFFPKFNNLHQTSSNIFKLKRPNRRVRQSGAIENFPSKKTFERENSFDGKQILAYAPRSDCAAYQNEARRIRQTKFPARKIFCQKSSGLLVATMRIRFRLNLMLSKDGEDSFQSPVTGAAATGQRAISNRQFKRIAG